GSGSRLFSGGFSAGRRRSPDRVVTPVVPLWGVAVALYAWECFVALPREGFALVSRGRGFRPADGRSLPGTRSRGYLLADPLPPFGLAFPFGGAAADAPETGFAAVRARLEEGRRAVRPLRFTGTVSFAGLFVVLPAAGVLGALPAGAPWRVGSVLPPPATAIALAPHARLRLGIAAGWRENLMVAASPLTSL